MGLLLFAGSAAPPPGGPPIGGRANLLGDSRTAWGDLLMARREYAAAAKAYPDPPHRGGGTIPRRRVCGGREGEFRPPQDA